jgi:hypothetical protein
MARSFVQHAISAAPGFGHGNGPLDHMWKQRGERLDLDLWGSSWLITTGKSDET